MALNLSQTSPAQGSHEVPLLLLPGTLCDARLFAPLVERLNSEPLIAEAYRHANSTVQAAESILAHAPPRFAILGFSLGGIVALEIAALAPDRVAGMALIGSNARAVSCEHHEARREEAKVGAENLDHHVRKTLWPRYVGRTNVDNAALQDLIATMAVAAGGEALAHQTEIGLSRRDSRPRLPALNFPVLVLAGAEDTLAMPQMQYEMAAGLPDAELVIVPDAGHFVLLERPAIVASHVRRWLETVRKLHGPLAGAA